MPCLHRPDRPGIKKVTKCI